MTLRPLTLLTVIGIAALGAACASPSTSSQKTAAVPPIKGSDCLFFRTVYDWQVLDDHNMVIWAPGRRDAYQVYFLMPLIGLNFEYRLGFVDKDNDNQLCGFSRDEVVVPDRTFPQRSTISAMKHLDAADMARLEEQYKVKLTRDGKKQKPGEPERQSAQ